MTGLADEQAALRRVATLVARGASPAEVFETVAEEVGRLLAAASTGLLRFEPDDTVTLVGGWGRFSGTVPVGTRLPLGGVNVTSEIARTGQPARYDPSVRATGALGEHARDLNVRAAAGCPIVVAGRLWGAMTVAAVEGAALPPDLEPRLAEFTELVATAIANTEARVELARLADEQAALRRLALRVAQGVEPGEIFDAVVTEFHRLIGAAEVGLVRADSPTDVTIVAHQGNTPGLLRAGLCVPLDGDSAIARVLRTGRSARIDHTTAPTGTISDLAQRSGVTVAMGAPIIVDGRIWGALTASWHADEDLPRGDMEQRLAVFAELVDTAIATAESRHQLTASRARVLSAGDEARRQVVRDLHDGAQQRLVHTIITLKLAQRALRDDATRAGPLLAEALENAQRSNTELRELAHGLLPSVLNSGGLRSGVDAVISRLDVPVEVNITSMRFAPEIEASAYFVVAEALTNVVKHARATSARVTAVAEGGTLRVEVSDDGAGGADPGGHGLTGISDRVAALGGSLHIDSPPGGGTALCAEFPLPPG